MAIEGSSTFSAEDDDDASVVENKNLSFEMLRKLLKKLVFKGAVRKERQKCRKSLGVRENEGGEMSPQKIRQPIGRLPL